MKPALDDDNKKSKSKKLDKFSKFANKKEKNGKKGDNDEIEDDEECECPGDEKGTKTGKKKAKDGNGESKSVKKDDEGGEESKSVSKSTTNKKYDDEEDIENNGEDEEYQVDRKNEKLPKFSKKGDDDDEPADEREIGDKHYAKMPGEEDNEPTTKDPGKHPYIEVNPFDVSDPYDPNPVGRTRARDSIEGKTAKGVINPYGMDVELDNQKDEVPGKKWPKNRKKGRQASIVEALRGSVGKRRALGATKMTKVRSKASNKVRTSKGRGHSFGTKAAVRGSTARRGSSGTVTRGRSSSGHPMGLWRTFNNLYRSHLDWKKQKRQHDTKMDRMDAKSEVRDPDLAKDDAKNIKSIKKRHPGLSIGSKPPRIPTGFEGDYADSKSGERDRDKWLRSRAPKRFAPKSKVDTEKEKYVALRMKKVERWKDKYPESYERRKKEHGDKYDERESTKELRKVSEATYYREGPMRTFNNIVRSWLDAKKDRRRDILRKKSEAKRNRLDAKHHKLDVKHHKHDEKVGKQLDANKNRSVPDREDWWDDIKRKQDSGYKFNESLTMAESLALMGKAKQSGYKSSVIREVYNRGLEAWPGRSCNMNRKQYAFTRVNSYINNGKARKMDDDLT